jgi:hypothetical protein
MHDSVRHGYITFGWVATIVCVLLFGLLGKSYVTSEYNSSYYAEKCAGQYHDSSSPLSSVTPSSSDFETRKPKTEKENEPNWCDLAAQHSVAESTIWTKWAAWTSVIFTAIGVFLIWRTLIEAGKTTNAAISASNAAWDTLQETKKIGAAQTRAFLNCKGGEFKFTDRTIEFLIDVENFGSTPSKSMNIKAALSAMYFTTKDGLPESNRIALDEQETIFGVIPARGSKKVFIVWPRGSGRVEDFDLMISVGHGFILDLLLDWEDVFGERQRAVFFVREDGGNWFGEKPETSIRFGTLSAYYQSTRETLSTATVKSP